MHLYDKIRQAAKELKFDVSAQQISRIAGTVKIAGARTASQIDSIVLTQLQSLLEAVQKEAPVVKAEAKEATSFRQIDASLDNGTCPRCGKNMIAVKLADYTPARYCGGECRVVLWKPEN